MSCLSDKVTLIGGSAQFRIVEDARDGVPVYTFYSQADLDDDLKGLVTATEPGRQIRTAHEVVTASTGDVVFSLLSGTAAIVRPEHHGYLLTQNYIKLAPSQELDARYLVYLLNENRQIRKQLYVGQQGSITMKYSIAQLRNLRLPALPPKQRQAAIGGLYLDQLRLDALRRRANEAETILVLEAVRKADRA